MEGAHQRLSLLQLEDAEPDDVHIPLGAVHDVEQTRRRYVKLEPEVAETEPRQHNRTPHLGRPDVSPRTSQTHKTADNSDKFWKLNTVKIGPIC